MNLDYLARQFNKQLIDLINNCQLPPTLAYYVIKDVLDGISEQAANMCLQAEYELNEKHRTQTVTKEIPVNIVGMDKTEQADLDKNKE